MKKHKKYLFLLIFPILLSSWKALEKTGNEIKQDLEHESSKKEYWNCNLDKDKGCRIIKPDKIGEEKIFLLEK